MDTHGPRVFLEDIIAAETRVRFNELTTIPSQSNDKIKALAEELYRSILVIGNGVFLQPWEVPHLEEVVLVDEKGMPIDFGKFERSLSFEGEVVMLDFDLIIKMIRKALNDFIGETVRVGTEGQAIFRKTRKTMFDSGPAFLEPKSKKKK